MAGGGVDGAAGEAVEYSATRPRRSPKGETHRAGEGDGILGFRVANLAADLEEDERRSVDKTLRDAMSLFVVCASEREETLG